MAELRLTLRTLLAYLDDTLDPVDSRLMGQKLAENPGAQELVDRIKKVTRKRGLATPAAGADGSPGDPNTVAAYISDALVGDRLTAYETACLESDVHLAEVASCHQILTVVLSQPVRVPPTARRRMYELAKGKESVPGRPPGDIPPVGGVLPEADKAAAAADESDPPYLLGNTASAGRRATLAAVGAGLAAGLAAVVWFGVPGSVPLPDEPAPAFALVTVARPAPKPEPKVEAAPPPVPVPNPMKDKDPDPKPPEPKPADPVPPVPAPGDPKADGPKPPAGDLVPKPPAAARMDVGPIGKFERSLPAPILLRTVDADTRTRVTADDPVVQSAQRLLVLPGYKAKVRLDTGVGLELWGNLPDLLAGPLLQAAVTPHAPAAGFDADLTVHTGRVYLSARKPDGGTVRLRFAGQVWDVALPDDKAEVAFEVVHALVPGPAVEAPRASAALGVVTGTAKLTAGLKTVPEVKAGEVVSWDSKGAGLTGPRKVDGPNGPSTYFARFPLAPDAAQAKLALTALDDLSKKLTDPARAEVVLAEMLADRGDRMMAADVATVRVGVLVEAALGNVSVLVEALGDGKRRFAREQAVLGLQSALALDPDLAGPFAQALVDEARLAPDAADAVVRMVRGFTPAELKAAAVLDKLVDSLNAPDVCVRELAFMTLVTAADPEARANPALARFDAGGSDADRDAVVKAWKRRADELKKKAAEPNGK